MSDIKRKKKLVSVLICTYNAEKYIKNTIFSVINQSYENIEVLILDNDSKDKTVSILKDLEKKDSRIKLFLSERNYGAYGGLNFLLDKAKGKYVAIQDHDDLWSQLKLEKQVMFLEKRDNKKFVGCGTQMYNFYEKYKKLIKSHYKKYSKSTPHSSLVYRNLGFRYNVNIKVSTDFYFMRFILCKDEDKIYNFDEALITRVIRSDGKNFSNLWINKDSLKQYLSSVFFKEANFFDKIYTIYHAFFPTKIRHFISVNVFSRSKFISLQEFKKEEPIIYNYIKNY